MSLDLKFHTAVALCYGFGKDLMMCFPVWCRYENIIHFCSGSLYVVEHTVNNSVEYGGGGIFYPKC